jgi:hypothetical protein
MICIGCGDGQRIGNAARLRAQRRQNPLRAALGRVVPFAIVDDSYNERLRPYMTAAEYVAIIACINERLAARGFPNVRKGLRAYLAALALFCVGGVACLAGTTASMLTRGPYLVAILVFVVMLGGCAGTLCTMNCNRRSAGARAMALLNPLQDILAMEVNPHWAVRGVAFEVSTRTVLAVSGNRIAIGTQVFLRCALAPMAVTSPLTAAGAAVGRVPLPQGPPPPYYGMQPLHAVATSSMMPPTMHGAEVPDYLPPVARRPIGHGSAVLAA